MRYLVFAVLLSGCSAQEVAKRDAERAISTYGPACEKLGFSLNTDPWRDCIIRMSDRRR